MRAYIVQKSGAEVAASLFDILSRGHSRFVRDLGKILGKSQDCRSCTVIPRRRRGLVSLKARPASGNAEKMDGRNNATVDN
jgi:hypothetical protein